MAQFPPFAKVKDAPVAEAPAVETTQAPAPAATKAPKVKGVTKSGEDRKKPAPQMNGEQVKQILTMVKDKSYTQIAEEIGVTKFQVNRVLMSTKKQLRESAANNPVQLAKVEEYIKNYLSRPEDTLPGHGGNKGGGKVKGALDSVVGDILNSIG
jgi:hypothetical protein